MRVEGTVIGFIAENSRRVIEAEQELADRLCAESEATKEADEERTDQEEDQGQDEESSEEEPKRKERRVCQ